MCKAMCSTYIYVIRKQNSYKELLRQVKLKKKKKNDLSFFAQIIILCILGYFT